MRTFEDVRREQAEALTQFGFHTIKAEQFKAKILALATEVDAFTELERNRQEEKKKESSNDQG